MIFGSLGLLVLSLMLLIFGITRTSLTLLVMALCAAGLASVLLIAAYQAHKARLLAAGLATGTTPTGTGMAAPTGAALPMAAMANGQAVFFVPVAANGQPLVMPAPGNGDHGGPPNDAPLVGYDAMSAAQIIKLIGSGALTDDQLDAIERYEGSHQQRKTVLQALPGARAT